MRLHPAVMPFSISRRVTALALMSAFIVLVATGCGSSSSPSSATASTTSQDAARVKFTQCMRDNGVDLPDNPGQGGGARPNIDRTKLQAAAKACQKYQQAAVGDISDAQRQEFQDAFARFSACMRQNGVDLPAPGSGGGPPAGGGGQLDQSDPKVQAATKACQDKLPQRGQGGPGGPPGGGDGN